MKRFFKTALSLSVVALILVLSCSSAFAASGLVINDDAKAKKGDKITYTLYLGDCTEELCGIQMQLFYDSEYLELDEKSLSFPNIKGAVSNAKLENIIPFNWTTATDFVSFKKTKPLVTVDFKVKKAGNTDITYFVTELYGPDITYLRSFTFSNSIDVNGKTVIDKAAPKLNTDPENMNEYQGSFVNYADGKGEKNGSGKGHYKVEGTFTPDVPSPTEVSKGSDNTATILWICAAAVVVLVIVIVVIIRKHYSK